LGHGCRASKRGGMTFDMSCLDCEMLVRVVKICAAVITVVVLLVGLIVLEFVRQEGDRRRRGR